MKIFLIIFCSFTLIAGIAALAYNSGKGPAKQKDGISELLQQSDSVLSKAEEANLNIHLRKQAQRIAALEAMATGLPMVLTRIGGAAEMITEGNGFLCEPTDEDIAEKWHKALITRYDRNSIHAYVRTNFGAAKMIEEYKKIL